MKTDAIHAAFTTPTIYTWSAAVTLRHPEKGDLSVQFGNSHRFDCPYAAEADIAYKIVDGSAIEFPGYRVADIDVWAFRRASDSAL
jgi:hypothetical protein